MGDFLQLSRTGTNVTPIAISTNVQPDRSPVVHMPDSSRTIFKGFDLLNQVISGKGTTIDIGVFLLKLAALDVARRISKAKCPWLWEGLQALQIFCIPPLKWIQRWDPFKGLITCLQRLSRPMLVLSVATSLSNQFFCAKESQISSNIPQECLELSRESPSGSASGNTRIIEEIRQTITTEKWLVQLHEELRKQGIVLPERISDDELRSFHKAANGDFSTLLSSVKKTVRWRRAYGILSQEELEVWSHLVF